MSVWSSALTKAGATVHLSNVIIWAAEKYDEVVEIVKV
jgi:hypothetical protein